MSTFVRAFTNFTCLAFLRSYKHLHNSIMIKLVDSEVKSKGRLSLPLVFCRIFLMSKLDEVKSPKVPEAFSCSFSSQSCANSYLYFFFVAPVRLEMTRGWFLRSQMGRLTSKCLKKRNAPQVSEVVSSITNNSTTRKHICISLHERRRCSFVTGVTTGAFTNDNHLRWLKAQV